MNIVYYMHIDWGWIKQRPHFISEELSKDNNVSVLYTKAFHRDDKCDNDTSFVRPYGVLHIPGWHKYEFIKKINIFFTRFIVSNKLRAIKPEVIILSHPELLSFIPKKYYNIISYDCMDDYYSMDKNEDTLKDEKVLVSKARHIFTSSESLKNKLIKRHNANSHIIHVVRNGYDGLAYEGKYEKNADGMFHICYIGTISTWLDMDLIIKIIDRYKDVVIDLVGPMEPGREEYFIKYSNSQRLVFHGKIEHNKLEEIVRKMDVLIMPFVVNDIIESVDPVKLYEYINFDRNIVTVHYNEINRFKDFVHFYQSEEELLKIIGNLLIDNTCKYSLEEKEKFLSLNTWTKRKEEIIEILKANY